MDTAARRTLLGGLVAGGVVATGAAPADAATKRWTPRLLPARKLVPGDLVVGPDTSVVRIATRTRLEDGRHQLRYTHPHTGLPTPFSAQADEEGYAGSRRFAVLQRDVPVAAVQLTEAPPPVDPGGPAQGSGLVVDVRAAPYHAKGDGETDDTLAIRRALADTPPTGTCWFPPGTYLVAAGDGAILSPPAGVTLAGAGRDLSVLVTAEAATASRMIDVSGRPDVTVRDLWLDGASHPSTRCGVFANHRGSKKNLRVERCRFTDFMPAEATTTTAAVYTWTSDGVHVLDNEFTGCGRAITIDQPDGQVRVVGNRISAPTGVMVTGILVRRSSGSSESEVVLDSNHVQGADRDPSGVGTEGHGIAVYRVRDVHITHNHCQGNRRGILVSAGGFGAVLQGNTCTANSDAGIRVEPEIALKDTTVGVGVPRGVTLVGNTCRDNAAIGTPSGANAGIGITLSYAAGSTVVGNLCHDNTGDGIFCDSDRVSIIGNTCYSNFRGYSGPPTTGQRAGIRIYEGTGCTVVGNQCFDNRAEPTQDYGLSLSTPDSWHVVQGNNFAGNGVGEVWGPEKIREGFFGTPPVQRPVAPEPAIGLDAATINAIIQGLKDLGLFR